MNRLAAVALLVLLWLPLDPAVCQTRVPPNLRNLSQSL